MDSIVQPSTDQSQACLLSKIIYQTDKFMVFSLAKEFLRRAIFLLLQLLFFCGSSLCANGEVVIESEGGSAIRIEFTNSIIMTMIMTSMREMKLCARGKTQP